ncbi:MAG: polysaccharide biosynthesis protein [Oscillospiraceae bacterium]|nr:polysaccharide biosynthesis protein [Oscillospiraceae bacterium]
MYEEKKKAKHTILKKETFMQGVISIIFAQVLIKLLGAVYRVYLTNRPGFGDAGNAIQNAGFQIYALLLTISSIGVPSAISKMVSEKVAVGNYKSAHRIFRVAFATFAVIGFIGTLLLFFGAHYIANVWLVIPQAEDTLIALSPAIFFVSIASVIRGYFQGISKLSISARSQTVEQVFKTVWTVVLVELIAVFSGANTTLMAAGANLASTLSIFMSFGYLYLYYNKYKKEIWHLINTQEKSVIYKPERARRVAKNVLAVAFPISLSSIISAINKNIDSVTVVRGLKHFMSDAAATVQYGILGGKVDILIGLPLSFNIAFATALVPALAGAISTGDHKSIVNRVSFSLLITILIGLPCTIGLCVFANPILNLLFPNAPDGALILQISAFTVIFTCIAQTINGALQGLGKIVVPAIALGTGVIVKVILNVLLIPIPAFGIYAAAGSSVVCHIINCTIGYSVLRKKVKLNVGFKNMIFKPIVATAIMAICGWAAYTQLTHVVSVRIAAIFALSLSVIIYSLAVVVMKVLSKDDIHMLPKGAKIYNFLVKIGIYKEQAA